MTEQAKHQALLVDRLRHMVVHARRQAASRSASEALAVMAGSAARRSARRRGFSGRLETIDIRHLHVHQHRVERHARLQHLLNARQPAVGEGHPGALAAQQLGGDLAVQRVVLHYQQTHAPQPLGALHRARRRVGRGALFAVQRMQHRVGQLLGRDRLGEKIDEGRRAVVARIGQHLAAIGSDHDHHGRRQVALQLADQLRRAEAVEIGHAPIHQHHVVATALGHRRPDPRHRLAAAADAVGAPAEGADRAFEQLAGHQVVVRHQQPQRFAGPGAGARSGWSWATSRSGRTRTGYRCPARSRPAIPRSPAIRN